MISANDFARTAREVFERSVPYELGGNTLKGMDSSGFIQYCLKKNGINISFSGTNDIYRNAGNRCISLKQAKAENQVVPGTLLLCVEDDGREPVQYRGDGYGNCLYAMIAISSTEGVYPSEKRQGMIKRPIVLENGKPNRLMFCKYVDYGAPAVSTPSCSPSASNIAYTTSALNLRKAPSTSAEGIATMPRGSELIVLDAQADWVKVKYVVSATLWHEGWCSRNYLRFP